MPIPISDPLAHFENVTELYRNPLPLKNHCSSRRQLPPKCVDFFPEKHCLRVLFLEEKYLNYEKKFVFLTEICLDRIDFCFTYFSLIIIAYHKS